MPQNAHQTVDILPLLHGKWAVTRTIFDKSPQETTSGEGLAAFSPAESPSQRLFTERLTLFLPHGAQTSAEQAYVFTEESETLSLHFAAGPRAGQVYVSYILPTPLVFPLALEATHHCGPDVYTHSLTFVAENCFTTRTAIHGPQKDLVVESTYKKQAD